MAVRFNLVHVSGVWLLAPIDHSRMRLQWRTRRFSAANVVRFYDLAIEWLPLQMHTSSAVRSRILHCHFTEQRPPRNDTKTPGIRRQMCGQFCRPPTLGSSWDKRDSGSVEKNRRKMAVDYLMVPKWSFNARSLLWLFDDIESLACMLEIY